MLEQEEWHLVKASRKDNDTQGASPLTASTQGRPRISPDGHTSWLSFLSDYRITSKQCLHGGRTTPEGVAIVGTSTRTTSDFSRWFVTICCRTCTAEARHIASHDKSTMRSPYLTTVGEDKVEESWTLPGPLGHHWCSAVRDPRRLHDPPPQFALALSSRALDPPRELADTSGHIFCDRASGPPGPATRRCANGRRPTNHGHWRAQL
jgi:hypothetical protein